MKIDHYDHSSSEAESESEEADLEESKSYPNAVYILVFCQNGKFSVRI